MGFSSHFSAIFLPLSSTTSRHNLHNPHPVCYARYPPPPPISPSSPPVFSIFPPSPFFPSIFPHSPPFVSNLPISPILPDSKILGGCLKRLRFLASPQQLGISRGRLAAVSHAPPAVDCLPTSAGPTAVPKGLMSPTGPTVERPAPSAGLPEHQRTARSAARGAARLLPQRHAALGQVALHRRVQ